MKFFEKSGFATIYFTACLITACVLFSGCFGSSSPAGVAGVKTLAGLKAARYEDTVEIAARYDFSRTGVTAVYSDGETRAVSPSWKAGGVRVDPLSYFAPADECVVPLIAEYEEERLLKTLEVKLFAVKAFSEAAFSLSPHAPQTAEAYIGYESPLLKIIIGAPTTETLIVKKLSFAVQSANGRAAVKSAAVSDGRSMWRAALSGGAMSFDFSNPPLIIPRNAINEITLAVNIAENSSGMSEETEARVEFLRGAGDYEIKGEIFAGKVMNNIKGLELKSGRIVLKRPPADEIPIGPADASGYSVSLITVPAGSEKCLSVQGFDETVEEFASIIASPEGAEGSYLFKTFARGVSAPQVSTAAGVRRHAGAFNFDALDGQAAADMQMRIADAGLLAGGMKPGLNRGTSAARAPREYKKGDLESFSVINVKSYQWQTVTAEVAAVGERCYIFEETQMPERYERMSGEWAREIARRFDSEIYSKVTGAFGGEPNPGIDADPKIFILFTRVVNEGTALGYFSSMNQFARYNEQGIEQFRNSNEKEIIFSGVFDRESEFRDREGFFNLLFSVIAHEFQHMINWYRHSLVNGYEETWVNEGLSMLAEDVSGYGYQRNFYARRVAEFFNEANSYSLNNFKYLNRGSYGYSYLFFRYLYERGADIKNIVQSAKSGTANVEAEIIRAGIAPNIGAAFEEFLITLYFASEGKKPSARYSYQDLKLKGFLNFASSFDVNLNGLNAAADASVPFVYKSSQLNGYGFNLIRLNSACGQSPLKINISNAGPRDFKVITIRTKK